MLPIAVRGKGSIQETMPALGQHNLLDRLARIPGQPLYDQVMGNTPPPPSPFTDLGGAINNFFRVMPIGPFGSVRIPNPIRAYHGSSHAFDAFDLSRIGTGQGAQAYGHGLYFAESEPVARSYRNATLSSPESYASLLMEQHGGRDGAIRWLQEGGLSRQFDRDALAALQGGRNFGHMYEVNIHARPEQFLDWDRLFGDMSPEAQARLRHAGFTENEGYMPSFVDYLQTRHGPQGASNVLHDAGFSGIRYLDQGSRGAGQGTSNYVLFDPSLVEILRRYGIAAPVAGGAAAASLMDRQQE